MKVSLIAPLQKFVQEQVQAGRFRSTDELINAAVAQFQVEREPEPLTPEDLEELRAEIAIGIAQADRGELEEWDPKEIWTEVERRYAEEQRRK